MIKNTSELEIIIDNEVRAMDKLEDIKQESSRYDNIQLFTDTMDDPSNELLDLINSQLVVLGIGLDSFEPVTIYSIEKYQINCFRLSISGDFISILKAIDFVERSSKLTKLASVRYYLKNNNNYDTQLYAQLTLQFISQK